MPNSLSELHTLHAWEDNQITERCTQGEYAGKVLQFKLVDKDGAINLSNCLVQYAVTRPDKTEDLLDCTVDNGVVKCNLTYSVTSVVGLVHGEVRVIGSNDSGIIKFYGVNLRVYKGVSDEAAEQSDEFTALIAALQKVVSITPDPDSENTYVVRLDDSIVQNGLNPVSSGVLYDALQNKVNYKKATTVGTSTDEQPHIDEATDRKTFYKVYGTNGVDDGWLLFLGDKNASVGSSVSQIHFPRAQEPRIRVGTIAHNGSTAYVDWGNAEWKKLAYLSSALSGARYANPDTTFSLQNDGVTTYMSSGSYSPSDYTVTNIPSPVPSSWTDKPNSAQITVPDGATSVTLFDTIDETEWVTTVSGSTFQIYNLIPDRNYLCNVVNNSGKILKTSVVKASGQVRMIDAGGDTFNIRDIGGWNCDGGKLKYGMIYRGAELDVGVELSEDQCDYFKTFLGVRNEIDLRLDSEVDGATDSALGIGVNYVRYPINANAYQNIYLGSLQNTIQTIKRVAQNIRSNTATYIHCTRGADRTACICMLIEAICGVSQSDLDKDFELTTFTANNFTGTKYASLIKRRKDGVDGAACWKNMMIHFMNESGDSFRDKIIRFLISNGVTISDINDIRYGLIEGNPAKLNSPFADATVTGNLTNISLRNPAAFVEMYQPYESAVDVLNDSYKITELRITMGASDVSTYYSHGTISIPKVTGDIIIEGTAELYKIGISDISSELSNLIDSKADSDDLDTFKDEVAEEVDEILQDITNLENASIATNNAVADIKAYIGYTDGDILGVCVDFENNCFTRLAGAVGLSAGADFDAFQMYGGRKRVVVTSDGTIDWDTPPTEIDGQDDAVDYDVMVYQPKFYYKMVPLKLEKQTGNGMGYQIRKANYYISATPHAGFKLHPLFYDANGNEIDYVLLSAYEASYLYWYETSSATGYKYFMDGVDTDTTIAAGDVLKSMPTAKPISSGRKALTVDGMERVAQQKSANWHLETIQAVSANQLLMLVEYAAFELQSVIGKGIVQHTTINGNMASLTGATASLGDASGMASETVFNFNGNNTTYATNGKLAVTYRGVENPWGNIWKQVQGINIWGDGSMNGGQPYICTDFQFSSSKHSDNYVGAGFTAANGSNYVSAFGYGDETFDWLFIASETDGDSIKPVGDNCFVTSDNDDYKRVNYGGRSDFGSTWAVAGAYTFAINSTITTRASNTGGRLLYVPDAEVS